MAKKAKKANTNIVDAMFTTNDTNTSVTMTLPATTTNTDIVVTNQETQNTLPVDVREDYEFSRKNLQDLMKLGYAAFERMVDIADQTQSSKDYRVVGELLTALTGTNSQLLEIHKKKKELHNQSLDMKAKNVLVDKAVFFGSTNELLELTSNLTKSNT